jgi:hypothetical protein
MEPLFTGTCIGSPRGALWPNEEGFEEEASWRNLDFEMTTQVVFDVHSRALEVHWKSYLMRSKRAGARFSASRAILRLKLAWS